MNKKPINQNIINIIIVIIIIIVLLCMLLYNSGYNYNYNSIIKQESFEDEPIDRTKLYGSLFLDKLDEIVKSLTNPSILYDTKRIELVRYNDVLL